MKDQTKEFPRVESDPLSGRKRTVGTWAAAVIWAVMSVGLCLWERIGCTHGAALGVGGKEEAESKRPALPWGDGSLSDFKGNRTGAQGAPDQCESLSDRAEFAELRTLN